MVSISVNSGSRFDVRTAYLCSENNKEVYVILSPGFEWEYNENNVLKLNKSMYGLPQSGRNWYRKFKQWMIILNKYYLKTVNLSEKKKVNSLL